MGRAISSAIEKLGDKIEARKIAASVGAPLVQGTQDPLNNADEVLEFAKQYGLPLPLKPRLVVVGVA